MQEVIRYAVVSSSKTNCPISKFRSKDLIAVPLKHVIPFMCTCFRMLLGCTSLSVQSSSLHRSRSLSTSRSKQLVENPVRRWIRGASCLKYLFFLSIGKQSIWHCVFSIWRSMWKGKWCFGRQQSGYAAVKNSTCLLCKADSPRAHEKSLLLCRITFTTSTRAR